jgi:hypothetical protein
MSDPVEAAKSSQLRGGYGVDAWLAVRLPAMMKLWQGVGGDSAFFVSEEDAREGTGAYRGSEPYQFAQSLWRFAQVRPSMKHGFRKAIREFVVDIDTDAAVGICLANPKLGSGTVLQYYVPDWERRLRPTGRSYTFPKTGH